MLIFYLGIGRWERISVICLATLYCLNCKVIWSLKKGCMRDRFMPIWGFSIIVH